MVSEYRVDYKSKTPRCSPNKAPMSSFLAFLPGSSHPNPLQGINISMTIPDKGLEISSFLLYNLFWVDSGVHGRASWSSTDGYRWTSQPTTQQTKSTKWDLPTVWATPPQRNKIVPQFAQKGSFSCLSKLCSKYGIFTNSVHEKGSATAVIDLCKIFSSPEKSSRNN